ncbi:MAG: sigma-70 family RNA polymerase sigma factor [Actinomycetota bacterium]
MTDFEATVREHEGRLHRLTWLLTLSREDAADITQETFARAWRDRESLATHPDPAAWLRRVAVNLCWDRSRHRTVRRRRDPLLATDPTTRLDAADLDLHRAVAALSPRQRQVIVLRYWADLDLRACADEMGVSVGSAKQHLARAHAALAIAPELSEDPT